MLWESLKKTGRMTAKFALCFLSGFSLLPLHGILEAAGVITFTTFSTTLYQWSPSCVIGDYKAPSSMIDRKQKNFHVEKYFSLNAASLFREGL